MVLRGLPFICAGPPTHSRLQLAGCWVCNSIAGLLGQLRPAGHLSLLLSTPSAPQYVAAPVMIGSLVLEAVADYQQQKDKEQQALAKAPTRWVATRSGV